MRYIEAAARIKPSRKTVRDEWRKQDVITKAAATADKVQLLPTRPSPVFILAALLLLLPLQIFVSLNLLIIHSSLGQLSTTTGARHL